MEPTKDPMRFVPMWFVRWAEDRYPYAFQWWGDYASFGVIILAVLWLVVTVVVHILWFAGVA
jgi:uncharacterized membrane protein